MALVSDAGTPLVADPGYRLAAEAIAAGHRGDGGARRLGGARRARGGRAADRPLPVRGLPAAARRGPAPGARRARGGAGDARLLREPAPARREPRRHGGGARRRPAGGGLPRADQALRGDPARHARRARGGAMPAAPEPRGEIVVLVGPPRGAGGERRRRSTRRWRRRCPGARCATPRRRWRRRSACRGGRSTPGRSRSGAAGVNHMAAEAVVGGGRMFQACSMHTAVAHQFGLAAEETAARRYRAEGGRVRAARWRCPEGEIDLVVDLPGEIVFVEVKARRAYGAEAVSARQWARIGAAATRYLAERDRRHPALPLRPRARRRRRPARAHRERAEPSTAGRLAWPAALGQDCRRARAGACPCPSTSPSRWIRSSGSTSTPTRPSGSWRRRRRAGTGCSTTRPTGWRSTRGG